MFEDSLFASSVQPHPQATAASLVSFFLQAVFITIAIGVPMFFTDAIPFRPARQIVQLPLAPRPAPAEPEIRHENRASDARNPLQVPRNMPAIVIRGEVEVAPPPSALQIAGGTGPGISDLRLAELLGSGSTVTPTILRSTRRARISGGVEQGLLISNIKPIYPSLARMAGIRGEAVLRAVIGKDGRIEDLRAISGSPLLIKAAVDAVQQWRYRPYLLNGEPVEVETQITVNFNMP